LPISHLAFDNCYVHLSNEMLEATKIDDGNIFTIYRYIILLLSPPVIVVVLIWQIFNIMDI